MKLQIKFYDLKKKEKHCIIESIVSVMFLFYMF